MLMVRDEETHLSVQIEENVKYYQALTELKNKHFIKTWRT